MAQRRFHYEQAFEHYLRANRIPYVAVDEARKALLPAGDAANAIKSFDFVVYGPGGRNLLLDVKGRKLAARSGRRLENWVTREDVEGLERWAELFGSGFEATFLFMYWCERQPPDALYEEIFEFAGRWYALRETPLGAYHREMRCRSPRWGTLCVSSEAFERISRPFSLRPAAAGSSTAEPTGGMPWQSGPGRGLSERQRSFPGQDRRRDDMPPRSGCGAAIAAIS